mgnify:CR=1 FL=1
MEKPRTFERFPTDSKCPVCGTNEDTECILLEIDGTLDEDKKICEAKPVHLYCAIAKRYNPAFGLLYTHVTKTD